MRNTQIKFDLVGADIETVVGNNFMVNQNHSAIEYFGGVAGFVCEDMKCVEDRKGTAASGQYRVTTSNDNQSMTVKGSLLEILQPYFQGDADILISLTLKNQTNSYQGFVRSFEFWNDFMTYFQKYREDYINNNWIFGYRQLSDEELKREALFQFLQMRSRVSTTCKTTPVESPTAAAWCGDLLKSSLKYVD